MPSAQQQPPQLRGGGLGQDPMPLPHHATADVAAIAAHYDDLLDDGQHDREADDDEEEDELEPDGQVEELPDATLPPAGLKEISSLASWNVSTSKPGCGVEALRSPDTTLFWQSDGPQPHFLSIHFFKLVSIVHMRMFLDFENDESYTPTKIQFWAGMGVHDLQQFAEMSFESPKGWIDVDFSNVGPVAANGDDEDGLQFEREIDWASRPVLRAFLVQVRIIENHQNGKDTHLRGLQIFARDQQVPARLAMPSSMPALARAQKDVRRPDATKQRKRADGPKIRQASWMLEAELR